MRGDRLRILVLGYIVRCPLGGMAWHYFQYVLGLHALGHDVWFLEDSEEHEWSCDDEVTSTSGTDPRTGLDFCARVSQRSDLGGRWTYHDAHTGTWYGNWSSPDDGHIAAADGAPIPARWLPLCCRPLSPDTLPYGTL